VGRVAAVTTQWQLLHRRRSKAANRARELARSGAHADHQSIFSRLREHEGFPDAEALFSLDLRHQIDRLCARAQQGRENGLLIVERVRAERASA
jgi:hypothetical protein